MCLEAFDLNNVDGHESYEYMYLLDRIEKIMAEAVTDADEKEQLKSELPVTKFLSTTKTSWANFNQICTQINREP